MVASTTLMMLLLPTNPYAPLMIPEICIPLPEARRSAIAYSSDARQSFAPLPSSPPLVSQQQREGMLPEAPRKTLTGTPQRLAAC